VIWEPLVFAFSAALTGYVGRRAAGAVAEATGHSRREAEYAAGTAGPSLIAHERRPRVVVEDGAGQQA
jgi:hypothetical protein